MTRKIQYYVNNDTYSNNLAIMFGENLNNNPLTWGGDYKDDVASHIPDDYFLSTGINEMEPSVLSEYGMLSMMVLM